MQSIQHFVDNGEGWQLALQQTWDAALLRRDRMPVLIVPGYGMNSFIFGYHPRGTSFERSLVEAGLEVWRVDLRAQGESRSIGGGDEYGLEDLALTDLGCAISGVLERTATSATQVSVIGASLGGTILFAHTLMVPEHRVGALVSMGGPVRWTKIHPLLRVVFSSPALAGMVRFKGTRQLARAVLPPLLKHTPWLLSIYMNPEHIDASAVDELTRTVEDPNRSINRQIAHWIANKDLVLRGTNLTHCLPRLRAPLLSVVANADGIVPRETALYPHHHVGSQERTILEVGNAELRLAHADMFISNHARDHVFTPIRDWLLARQS